MECMYLFELQFWPRSGIFYFLRKLHTVLHSGTPIYISTNTVTVPLSPHPLQLLLFVDFFKAILTELRWYLILALICICLIINNIEYFFMCLLAIWMSSLQKCLFRSPPYFLIRLFRVFTIKLYKLFVYYRS